jgi:Tfp pilus assembly protein PilX
MEQLSYRAARVGGGQSGVALIMVLIMLAAMMIAGVALIRVVDSANMISGNFSFRQATLNIADLGVEAAVAELKEIRANSSEAPYPAGCTTFCRYFPARSVGSAMLDPRGLPILGSVDGAATRVINWSGNDVNAVPRGYSVRYVIDRQCQVSPVTDAVNQCINYAPQSGGSKKSGATVFSSASVIYYRVSIQVSGPRNTQSHVQVMLGY